MPMTLPNLFSLAKREGLAVIQKIQEEALNGIPPGDRLVEGLMVLVGGVLLLSAWVLALNVSAFLAIEATRTRRSGAWTWPRLSRCRPTI